MKNLNLTAFEVKHKINTENTNDSVLWQAFKKAYKIADFILLNFLRYFRNIQISLI